MKKRKSALKLKRHSVSKKLVKKSTKLIARNPKKTAIKKRIRRNQPVHKRFILHPLTVLIILCISVFIISWTYKVVADFYSITATVAADPLSQGAYITSPTDNAVVQVQTINVSGTCPDSSYVNLYRNNIFSGTAWCVSNTFSITTSLFVGTNALRAQDYNITNAPGPVTPVVSITYVPLSVVITNPTSPQHPITTQPKSSPSNTTGNSLPANNQPPPLFVSSDFHYQTFTAGNSYKWTLQVEGGVPPYNITVNWGDGQVSKIYLPTDPTFTISHNYAKPGYYTVKITVTDATGDTSLLQLAALIKSVGASGVFNPSLNSCPVSGSANCPASVSSGSFSQLLKNVPHWLYIAWPSLLIVLLMLASFYLGEKQQYYAVLRKRRV